VVRSIDLPLIHLPFREDKIVDGEDKIIDGEDKIIDGEDKITDGEDKITDGEDKITDGEDKITDGIKIIEDERTKRIIEKYVKAYFMVQGEALHRNFSEYISKISISPDLYKRLKEDGEQLFIDENNSFMSVLVATYMTITAPTFDDFERSLRIKKAAIQ
jgi:hypothetical protein